MKQILFLVALIFCGVIQVVAQTKDYRVVFDITSKDTNVHKAVIRWCNEILKTEPSARLEVVYYGQSLEMITQGRSIVAGEVSRLITDKKVSFIVCASAMQRWNIDRSQLLPGVQTVPDGIYEILQRQREGYGYIKAAL